MIKLCLTLNLIVLSIISNAQIETDRPGNTIIPQTVLKKWLQFETGFLLQTEKVVPPNSDLFIQHPSLLAKYGLGKRIEIRLITELSTIKEKDLNKVTTFSGINTFQLGGKFNFLNEKGVRPKISLIAHYSFNGLRTIVKGKDSIDGVYFRFAMQHTVTDNFIIGYNIGMQWMRFGSPQAYLYTFSPKFNINENWQVFLELYGYAWKKRTPQNSIDGGISYFINDNFKIDAAAGFGLNKNAPDKFYALGLSYRFKVSK